METVIKVNRLLSMKNAKYQLNMHRVIVLYALDFTILIVAGWQIWKATKPGKYKRC
jgi:hypothetical protein